MKAVIGHFRVLLCLCFKTSLSAKPFILKWVLLAVSFHANQSHFHENGFALRLALKQRHKRTRKWPIVWNASFRLASRSFKTQLQTILRFSIAADRSKPVFWRSSRLNWQLHHVLRSYKHEAFQKVKYKLDLIEQPYLDQIHSRLMTVNGL